MDRTVELLRLTVGSNPTRGLTRCNPAAYRKERLMDKKLFKTKLAELQSSGKKFDILLQAVCNAAIQYAFPKTDGGYEDYNAVARVMNAMYKGRQSQTLDRLRKYFKFHGPFAIAFDNKKKQWSCKKDQSEDAKAIIEPVVAFHDFEIKGLERSWTVEGMQSSIKRVIKDINDHFTGEVRDQLLSEARTAINDVLAPASEGGEESLIEADVPAEDSTEVIAQLEQVA